MVSPQDKTPEKVRIKDSYRERIFQESQRLGKSYLETLYFIVDCYFAFKQGALPGQTHLNFMLGMGVAFVLRCMGELWHCGIQ